MTIRIGTAGWSIPQEHAGRFPDHGTALERYSSIFNAVEINSSFHRPHRLSTWERWRESVPDAFRFSVKMPKQITHERKLAECEEPLDDFLAQLSMLGPKLGALLVQLPPKLALDEPVASSFFAQLKARTDVPVACEPRHLSWFGPQADEMFERLGISRVGADPAICEAAAKPIGRLSYRRLHGSPVIYRSSYDGRLTGLRRELLRAAHEHEDSWCIFDNTASSAATADALALKDDAEHPVPEPLRSTFRQIANAFVAGDFQLCDHRIDSVEPIDAVTARQIADNVAGYGEPLAPLNDATWERSIYRWMDGYWQILVDLSTEEEAVSDLAIHAILFEGDAARLQITSVHVP